MGIKKHLKNNYYIYKLYDRLRFVLPNKIFGAKYDRHEIRKKYIKAFGREPSLDNPQTLNEKIQWLKLNVHDDFHTVVADKYRVREYLKQFGEDALIPLLYHTDNWRDIKPENIPEVPCIVKYNAGCGCYAIIRDKKNIDYKTLKKKCRLWFSTNLYYRSQEWQYKNIKPCIIVEKLLLDKHGRIPNDYKLHYINGELQFIYCSIDREGENYRSIYSPDWHRMNIEWLPLTSHKGSLEGKDISAPPTLDRMKAVGREIAKNFKYVRVDFYDVDGQMYYGEITLHHGSGFDTFEPEKYDWEYGKILDIK